MTDTNNTQGQDAFLDIVANLVGILIILVVIVGASAAQSASRTNVIDEGLATEIHQASLEAGKQSTVLKKVSVDNEALERLIDAEKLAARQLTEIRHQRLVELETVRHMIAKQMQAAASKDRNRIEADADRRALEQKLAAVKESVAAVKHRVSSAADVDLKTIEHFPNPIAKTVFSEEVHFCLSRGKLIWVPLDELVEEMKQHWRLIADNLTFQRTRQTIGPIGNFRLQYELNSVGERHNRRIQFRRFSLVPVNVEAGENVQQALDSANSDWAQVLRKHVPEKTTVSIWVYPDSYAEHAEIKQWLHHRQFKMASWPLEHGRFISGGPDGFRTSAQ